MKKLLVLCLILVTSFALVASAKDKKMAIIDSYPESNYNDVLVSSEAPAYYYVGESFTSTGAFTLDSVKFYLSGFNAGVGNTYAQIYLATGTAPNIKPTGSVLATSDPVTDADLPDYPTVALQEFVFSGNNKIALAANTQYVAVFLSQLNIPVLVGIDSGEELVDRNASSFNLSTQQWETGNFLYQNNLIFYVYGTEINQTKYTGVKLTGVTIH